MDSVKDRPRSNQRQREALLTTRLLPEEEALVRRVARDRQISISALLRSAVLKELAAN